MARSIRVTEEARRQPFVQIVLFVALVLITVAVCLIDPGLISPAYVVAALGIALLTGVMLVARRRRLGEESGRTLWFAAVPLLDIAACAFVRADVIESLPAAGLLVIFPIAWLSFAFPAAFVAAGIAGTVFITAYPLILDGSGISSVADWAVVLTLPLLITLFALATAWVGRDLARRQARAESAAERAESARRASARADLTIQTLAETSPDALAVFDTDGRVIVANDAALAVAVRAGRPELAFSEGPAEVYDRTGDLRFEIGQVTVERVLAGELAEPQVVLVGPPEGRIVLSVVARPVIGPEGEVTAVVMFGHDITELMQAVEVRDLFLDDVGHELKTPLTAILGHADLLVDSPDAATAGIAETIRRAAERQLGIVNQLIAAGRRTIAAEIGSARTAALGVIEGAVRTARATAEQKGVELAVVPDLAEGADLVAVDARDLVALVEALAMNAVLFTPAGGTVVLGLRRDDDRVVLEVSDTGVGMSADELERAFDRFYRAPASREGAVPGLGLGLGIARTLAESNGAAIGIDSTLGRGTLVTVRMPAA